MNPSRRAHIVLLAAVVACACAAMLALGPREPATKGAGEAGDGGVILHVDDDASAGGDGLTWRSAIRFLQDALDAAREPGSGVTEIRIAQGEYKPDQGASVTPGDIDASFEMVSGIALRGGYAGLGAPDPDARDWATFESVLNGDLLGNDGPNHSSILDNCYNVVSVIDRDHVVLQGLSIERGYAWLFRDEAGGGVQAKRSGLSIVDCYIRNCQADQFGAGIYALDCRLSITRCVIEDNQTVYGGGAFIDGGELRISASEFINNEAGQFSGGLEMLHMVQMPVIENCRFAHNSATISGGGAQGWALWRNCVFEQNYCEDRQAGAAMAGVVIDCVFRENASGFEGAGLTMVGFQTNWVINCQFIYNQNYEDQGAGVLVRGTSASVNHFIGCRFLGNLGHGPEAVGGGAYVMRGVATFTNCEFSGNESAECGAVAVDPMAVSVTFSNCSFSQNVARKGVVGAVGGIFSAVGSVFWNSVPGHFPPAQGNSITYSCVENGAAGVGVITSDPRFMNPLGIDGVAGTADDDLRLQGDSPCIDAANSLALPADEQDLDVDGDVTESIPVDLAGRVRLREHPGAADIGIPSPRCRIVADMGAHEFQPDARAGDTNLDGVVDIDDLLIVISSWGRCPSTDCPDTCFADMAPRGGDGVVGIDDLLAVLANWRP